MPDAPRLTDFASCAGCAGKVPPGRISELLALIPANRPAGLLVGTETHDDAGVFQLTPELALVQTVDFFPPLVDDPYEYGRIAAANALSDVYAMGGEPVTAMNVVCYPDDALDFGWLGRILAGAAERCAAAGCAVVGGHTLRDKEIKFGLSVTGTVHPAKVVTNAGAKPGDVLILTKPLGTGFVTTAAKRRICPPDLLRAAVESMTTLNKIGRDAMLRHGANAATDVTGFGLAGHAYEMATGSNVTVRLDTGSLPLLPGIESLDLPACRTRASKTNREYTERETVFSGKIDPMRMEFLYDAQTSGGLLVSVPRDRAAALKADLLLSGTAVAAQVGEVLTRGESVLAIS